MNGKRHKLLTLILALIITLSLSGCFDLGEFGGSNRGIDNSDYETMYASYYLSFGSIYLISQNKNEKDYSLKNSFFNPTTVNKLDWEDDDYKVPSNEYIGMYFEAYKDIYIDELSLYAKGVLDEATTVKLNIYMYIVSSDTFDTLFAYDDEFDKDKTYDIKDKSTAICSATVSLSGNKWNSFSMKRFLDSDSTSKDRVKVCAGQYILLSFYNNSGYGKQEGLQKISFTCLNLLIRGFEEEA